MIAAVLLPAILVRLSALRLFLAVADGLDGVCTNTVPNQRLLGRVSTMLTQRQVVFGGTTVVTVALNLYFPAFLLDDLCSLCESLLRIRTQVRLVIVEVNVLDHLSKELFVCDGWRGRRNRRWGWFCRYLNLCGGFLRSSRTPRGPMIR